MGVAFISKILELFAQIFMKFWNLPMADLGFNLGTFVVFILLIKFAMSVFFKYWYSASFYIGYCKAKL